MRMKGYITKITLDRGKASKTFEKNCEKLIRAAAREWVRAVIIRIPVWTGMALGSIKYAKGRSGESSGQFLSAYLRVAIPIEPIKEVRSDKSPELGGVKARYTFSHSDGQYRFTFTEQIGYVNFSDSNKSVSPTSPWKSFKTGEQAFHNYVKAHAKETVPNLKEFIVRTNVKVG